jgi:DNA-binding PadR family transcriptional regulator
MSLVIDQREALNLLARSTHGYRESILAHGFPIETLRRLMRDGLVIAEREPAHVNRRAIVVTRVRITDAGRRALVG